MAIIYLARSENQLRKTFKQDGDKAIEDKESFNPGFTFDYSPHEVITLHDVHELLQSLVDDPHSAIVMGEPTISFGERNKAYFNELSSEFWFIDLDGVPEDDNPRATIERCLPFLAGKAYIFAYTQSAGIKPGLRARVICRLPKPMLSSELEAYARHYNDQLCAFEGIKTAYIDSKIYTPSRLLFTARPNLLGMADPHPDRVHLVDGDETPVVLDELPKMVEVTVAGSKTVFHELPRLMGTWGQGDGHGRSVEALKGIGMLRGYMGEKDWVDRGERSQLWREMIRIAGGVAEDFQKYSDFVNRRAKDARVPSGEKTVMAIANPDHSITLETAETQLEDHIRRAVKSMEPKVTAINVTMGTGKTYLALKHLAVQSRWMEANNIDCNIDFYVPTLKMGEEAHQTAAEHGLNGFVEYGRNQEVDGVPVCRKAEAAAKIHGLVDNVAEHLCKNKTDGCCEFYHDCRWQWQRNETSHIPFRIRAHNYLPLTMRSEHHEDFRPVNLVVIDEASFVDALLHTKTISIKDLIAPRLRKGDYDWVLKFAKVIEVGLSLENLKAAGFTVEIFSKLILAEEALKPIVRVTPSMSPKVSLGILKNVDTSWHRYASVWRCLRDCMDSGSMNRVRVRSDGDLSLAWKSPIEAIPWDHESNRPKVPVLILSGTMKKSIIEQIIPIDDWHEIDVKPHPKSKIVQSTFKGSKSECLYGSTEIRRDENGEKDPKKIAHAKSTQDTLRLIAKDRSLIAFKEFIELIGHKPSAHFFAIEGLNDFTGDDLVVYGRPDPGPWAMEEIARAIYCDGPNPIRQIKGPWYPSRRVARRGGGFGLADYHPDPRVEDIRWTICEGQIMQAIARSRYVREPVQVLVPHQTPLPLHIDRVIPKERIHPQWRDLEQSKVFYLSQNEYLRRWPKTFNDRSTAFRWAKKNAPTWADERKAFIIEFSIRGSRGPKKKALIDGICAIAELGDVKDWKLTDDPHNDWALQSRELEDMLMRETLTDDEGIMIELGEDEEISLETAGGPSRVSGAEYAELMQSYSWPWM